MSAANQKIRRLVSLKPNTPAEPATDLETIVCQAFAELEQSSDLKAALAPLKIGRAIEVTVDEAQGTKAIVIFVPMPQLAAYKRIQSNLIRELEKKFGGKHIVILGNRRVIRPKDRKSGDYKQKIPMSRTSKFVFEAMLDDLLYPSELIGKRTRVHLTGNSTVKIHLQKKDANDLAHKLNSFSAVYKTLTNQKIVFEFPETA